MDKIGPFHTDTIGAAWRIGRAAVELCQMIFGEYVKNFSSCPSGPSAAQTFSFSVGCRA